MKNVDLKEPISKKETHKTVKKLSEPFSLIHRKYTESQPKDQEKASQRVKKDRNARMVVKFKIGRTDVLRNVGKLYLMVKLRKRNRWF